MKLYVKKWKSIFLFLILLTSLVGSGFFQSCGRSRGFREEAKEEYFYEEEFLEGVPAEEAKRAAPSERDATLEEPMMSEGLEATAALLPPEEKPEPIEQRKRVYSGYTKLLVGSVEDRRDEIITIAEDSGGYVESVYQNRIVVRVPAQHFSLIFEEILSVGEVLDKWIETFDVTEQFRDLETRLDIALNTRERLYALLKKTTDVKERLEILREIKRLTDEIERIKGNLRLLEEQVSFSRITVELVPRLAYEPEERDKIPFKWISDLDPLYVSIRDLKGRVSVELEDDFALFQKEKAFRAESADGIRIRIGTTPNDPQGDSSFWQKAISHHLEKYYGDYEELDINYLKAVLFTSKDSEPFYYLVGVRDRGRRLYVVEVFFPDRKALEGKLENVKTSLEGMKIR